MRLAGHVLVWALLYIAFATTTPPLVLVALGAAFLLSLLEAYAGRDH